MSIYYNYTSIFLNVNSYSYLMLASVVGVFSLPLLNRLKPRKYETPMTHIIGVCALLLILSSALPVLSRTLGKPLYTTVFTIYLFKYLLHNLILFLSIVLLLLY